MNLNIPDSIPKLLVLIGLSIVIFHFYRTDSNVKKFNSGIEKNLKLKDTLGLQNLMLKNKANTLKAKADYLSHKYNIENPVNLNDSIMTFKRNFQGSENNILLMDSIQKNWDEYLSMKFKVDLTIEKIKQAERKTKLNRKSFDLDEKYLNEVLVLGVVIFLIGLYGWTKVEKKREKIISKEIENKYKFCQSCGEKFSSMITFGTEKDKTKNKAFCIKCYKKGKFTNPELTREEFEKIYKEKIKSYNIFTRQILMVRFLTLERWKDNDYF